MTKSGVYRSLRLPVGPMPGPAIMQEYVFRKFSHLRSTITGEKICSNLADDFKISSASAAIHRSDVAQVLAAAEKCGFEFKLKKCWWNQSEVTLWGFVCDALGRRTTPKKVEQLINWPVPQTLLQLQGFMCFANYLREFLEPSSYLAALAVLSKFRKKHADFQLFLNEPRCLEAFYSMRKCLCEKAVLHYPDFVAAAHPDESGRPFEVFVDASDYGWAGVLTQRMVPHGTPKIIAIVCHPLNATQQGWSAMERELFALHG